MDLRQQREAVALEPLDQPDLPERLVAVEALREDAPRERAQLLLLARHRQGGGAHVVADVERGIVDPARAALAERDERELLAVARNQMQAFPDPVDELLI